MDFLLKKKRHRNRSLELSDFYLLPYVDMYRCFLDFINSGKFAYHPHRWLQNTVKASGIGEFESDLHIKNTVLINGELSNAGFFDKPAKGRKRENSLNYYLCNVELIHEYEKEMNELSVDEASIQDTVQAFLPEFSAEVRMGYKIGKADLVSEHSIVEIKRFLEWKHALGQILSYSYLHPKKKKILLLFEEKIDQDQLSEARSVCITCNVQVETIEGQECFNKWLQRTKLRYAPLCN